MEDGLIVNDSFNIPKNNNKIDDKRSNISSENISIDAPNYRDKKKSDFNEEVSSKITEEFWEDVKNVSRGKFVDEIGKNKEELSSILSKKNKYDNSLSKTVDFDDLITGGKITKNESDYMNLNTDYLETQTYNNYIPTEPNVSIVRKNSNKSISQTSVTLTQPNSSIRDSHYMNGNFERISMKKTDNNKGVTSRISNKNISRSTDKTPNKNNITSNYKIISKPTNKISSGYSNMKYNSVGPTISKPQNRNVSQDKSPSPTKSHLKTNSLVISKNSDKKVLSPIPDPKLVNKKSSCNSVSTSINKPKITVSSANKKMNSATPSNKTKVLPRINSLIKKGKEKEEKLRKQGLEAEEKRKASELQACTFKPKINNNYVPIQKSILNARQIPIYERQQMWNNKKIEKIVKEKNITEDKENTECTFTPAITKNKNLDYGQSKNDKPTRKFLERVNKAKKIKEEVNQKLNPNYNERYEKIQIIKNKPKRDTSPLMIEKDEEFVTFNPLLKDPHSGFNLARKNLHSKLHSLNIQSPDI